MCETCGAAFPLGHRRNKRFCSVKCKNASPAALSGRVIVNRRWRAENPEKARATRVAYSEQANAYSRAYYRDHPEVFRRLSAKHRAKVRGADVRAVTDRDWSRLVARFGGLCAYCGSSSALTRDHIIPLSRGGRHSIGNLLPACSKCNRSKSTRLLIEWLSRPLAHT